MRKEVKLGMAIGGALVVALVTYLFIAPPANKKGVQLVDGQSATDLGSAAGTVQPGDLVATNDKAGEKPQPKSAEAKSAGETPAPQKDPWKPALEKGQIPQPKPEQARNDAVTPPVESSKVPVVADSGNRESAAPLYFDPNGAYGGGLSTDGVGSARIKTNAGALIATKPADATPAKGGGTYEVKSGDTLSSISAAAYGSPNYFPHILRANPGINPNNLKLGTRLNLPPAGEVKVDSPAPSKGAANMIAEVKIDEKKQYRVQANDSLYKISLKLYGTHKLSDKIYEHNKAAIGPDQRKLKLGMILELPQAPGQVTTPSGATLDKVVDNTPWPEEAAFGSGDAPR